MKIISLYYTDKPGGFCKRLYRLLGALAEAGHDVEYLTLDQPPEQLSKSISIYIVPFPLKKRSGTLFWLLFTLIAPIAVYQRAKRHRTEKLVLFGAYYGAVARPAQMLLRISSILFIRSLVFEINRITEKPRILCWFSDVLERIGMRSAETLVAMSETMKAALEGFIGTEREIAILPNNVPEITGAGQEIPLSIKNLITEKKSAGKILVLISGVFDQRKNLRFTFEGLNAYHSKYPQSRIELLIAGAGAEADKLKSSVAEQGINYISFLGWVSPLDPIYPLIDLVLHPSRHEGMPNSVLEAWSHDIPAILADSAELREMSGEPELHIETTDPAALVQILYKIETEPGFIDHLRKLTMRAKSRLLFDWNSRAVALVAQNRLRDS